MKKLKSLIYFLIFIGLTINAQDICFDFPAYTRTTPGFPKNVTVADFNGDNYDDLAICHYDEDFISIMMNDGNGQFPGIITYPIEYGQGNLLVGDINHDHILDLVLVGMNYDIFTYLGVGNGNFNYCSLIWTDYWTADGELGYYDPDNHIDLAVLDQHQAKLRILSGNGEGSFQLTHTYPTSGEVPRKMIQSDFNVDGDTDFVVCNMGTEYHTAYNLVYFEGTGQGTFEPAVIIQDDYVPESIVFGDFNTDGNSDLIFKAFDRNLAKMWGNGDGTFQDPELEEISAIYYAIYLHEADINLDGALDLGMACYTFNMHVNDGSGNFSDTLYINEKSNNHTVNEIAFGYFNGDLKPDVISTHNNMPDLTYGAITVYLNCLPVDVPDATPADNSIRLYPNPGNGYMRIDSDQSLIGLKVTRVFNCNGMTLDENLYSFSGKSLDLSSQRPGLYFIQFIYGSQTINKKVIIY